MSMMRGAWRMVCVASFVLAMGGVIACSPLEPIDEPEVSDLQLTADTLKTSLRDAQRTIAELRAEVESRRQELADVQIARAQLEGRLREAERRLVEARHVIELQREELAGSRSERERVAKSGAMLRSQMKQLQLQLSKLTKSAGEPRDTGMTSAGMSSPRGRQSGVPPAMLDDSLTLEESVGVVATPAIHRRENSAVGGVPPAKPAMSRPARVSVKPGDTLWSIGQRHRISVKRLMALNHLPDNHIQVGQALWLIEPPAADEGGVENTE
jgi:LysM repeat protein